MVDRTVAEALLRSATVAQVAAELEVGKRTLERAMHQWRTTDHEAATTRRMATTTHQQRAQHHHASQQRRQQHTRHPYPHQEHA